MKTKSFSFRDDQYKVLFRSNPFPMWVYDLESLRFLAVNNAAIVKYGYSREEFLGMTIKEIRPAEDVEMLTENISTRHETYQDSSGWRHVKKDGSIIDVEIVSHEIMLDERKARLVTINDITEKLKAATELKAAEHRYRSTLDNMMEGFQIISPDWRYVYINNSAASQGQTTKDELTGFTMMEKYPGIENTGLFEILRRCMKERIPHRMENEFIFNDGSHGWFYLHIEPVPEGLLILSSDITDQKKSHNEIIHLNRVYAVLSSINQAIVRIKEKNLLISTACNVAVNDGKFAFSWIGMKDPDGNFLEQSAAASITIAPGIAAEYSLSPFLLPAAEAAVMNGEHFIINDLTVIEAEDAGRALKTLIENGCKSNIILPLIIFGETKGIFSLFAGEKNFFEKREIALLTEMVEDISFSIETMELEKKRIKTEFELQSSEKRFYDAFEFASTGNAIVGTDGTYMRVNKAMTEITGYPKDELLRMKFTDIAHPEDHESDIIARNKMLNKEVVTYAKEKRYIHKSGKEIWVLLNLALLRDNDDHPRYFITQIQDITLKKTAEKEIINAKEQAEEMNALKSNLLANMSHELRTPMIGILGTAELIKEAGSLDEIRHFLPTFEESSRRLLRTLNHLLDISKLESEKVSPDFTPLNIDKIIRQTISAYNETAAKKNLQLIAEFETVDNTALLDTDLLRDILGNLIHNAIKFTNAGQVTVRTRSTKRDGGRHILIEVEDTGIGIPEEKSRIIFEPFRQASEGLARMHEGTGLGLTLVKKYTEIMGGSIGLESVPGQGSKFTVIFPAAEAVVNADAERDYEGRDEISGGGAARVEDRLNAGVGVGTANEGERVREVLYIDDDKTAHLFVGTFLKGVCNLDSCTTGAAGLEMVRSKKYDLILIDINLGTGITGIDLIPEIKQIQGMDKVPLAAVTGYAMAGDKQRFLEAGFDHYIPKPFSREQLINAVSAMLRPQSTINN